MPSPTRRKSYPQLNLTLRSHSLPFTQTCLAANVISYGHVTIYGWLCYWTAAICLDGLFEGFPTGFGVVSVETGEGGLADV